MSDCYERRRIVLLYLLYRRIKARRALSKRKSPEWWVRPIFAERPFEGNWYNLVKQMRLSDPESHHRYFRMTASQFDELLRLIRPAITKNGTRRTVIPPEVRLATTLRYLASGDSQTSISFGDRVGRSTLCHIIPETCGAIWNALASKVLCMPDAAGWKAIADNFFYRTNFPNCAGAIDGKHVVINAPFNSGSRNFNYKGTFSVVLMAACDSNYLFTMVDIGAAGRQSDGGIFSSSAFGKAILRNELPLPSPLDLAGHHLPCAFVGDAAFPLRPNLMKPYPGRFLPASKSIFNMRLSSARRYIENSFGILAARWRVYRRPINAKEKTVKEIVKATLCLHNWLQEQSNASKNQAGSRQYCPPGLTDYVDDYGVLHEGRWRTQDMDGLRSLGQLGSNNHSGAAKDIRDRFGDFFMNSGAVPWQWETVPEYD